MHFLSYLLLMSLGTPASFHVYFPFQHDVESVSADVEAWITDYGIEYRAQIDFRGSEAFCVPSDVAVTGQLVAGYFEIQSTSGDALSYEYSVPGDIDPRTPDSYIVAPLEELFVIEGIIESVYFEDYKSVIEARSPLQLSVFVPAVRCDAIASGNVFMRYVPAESVSPEYIEENWRYASGSAGIAE